MIDLIELPKRVTKKGVLLQNSVQDWKSANEFFRTNIYHNTNIEDINSEIRDIQNTFYNYFSKNHGSVMDSKKNPFNTNCKGMSKNELKRQLKTLKNQIPTPEGEIIYVSKLLRHKSKKLKEENNFDLQAQYYKNFWTLATDKYSPDSLDGKDISLCMEIWGHSITIQKS